MSDDISQLIRETTIHLQAKRYPEAEATGLKLVARCPSRPEVTYLMAIICLETGRRARALGWLRSTLALSPKDPSALQCLGRILSEPSCRWMRFVITQPLDLILDVGANTGQFAQELRDLGYAERIVSFEPVPSAFAALQKHAAGDALWKPVNAGLGRVQEVKRIHISGNNAESSSFLPIEQLHLKVAPQSRTVDGFDATIDTVDHVMAGLEKPWRGSMLKVDTQGYEFEVLAGAASSLASFDLLYVEMSVVPLYTGQRLMHDVLRLAYDAGFAVVDIEPYMYDGSTGRLLQTNVMLANQRSGGHLSGSPQTRLSESP